MDGMRKLASRLQGWVEGLFPNWAHRRHQRHWERQWVNPEFSPFWKTDQPQKEIVDAIESGWFPKDKLIIDIGCGNGEVSRWLANQGLPVLGVDFSAAAIENCRRLSAGQPNAPAFEVADLCQEELRLEQAFSLVDRGCFHRIVKNLRPIFAKNIARLTTDGGHFLLLAATFQDNRVVNYSGVRSEPELREHVQGIFGNYFNIERDEPATINAAQGEEAMPALAFWMTRRRP